MNGWFGMAWKITMTMRMGMGMNFTGTTTAESVMGEEERRGEERLNYLFYILTHCMGWIKIEDDRLWMG